VVWKGGKVDAVVILQAGAGARRALRSLGGGGMRRGGGGGDAASPLRAGMWDLGA
jgi:hypothetical protein